MDARVRGIRSGHMCRPLQFPVWCWLWKKVSLPTLNGPKQATIAGAVRTIVIEGLAFFFFILNEIQRENNCN